MKREGWASAVGKVYLTRNGREVRITQYSVFYADGGVHEELQGELIDESSQTLDFNEQGRFLGWFPGPLSEALPNEHALDLVEAKQH